MLETSPSNGYKQTTSFFTSCRFLLPITLAVIFILGLGIRLYDLTDPPLDFHATRQLRSLLMARGLYHKWFEDPNIPDWQRQIAIEQWEGHQIIEPPIFEIIAALTYGLVGFETDWIARIWASLFWLIGGAALFLVARRLSSADGGVVALAFYIFLPFGVIASRSFQPDPLMVMWIVVSWWTFYRWYQSPSWQRAIFAGLSAGMALLTKNVSVFFLLFPFAALLLMGKGFKKTLRDPQSWVIAGLAALPLVIFTLYGLWVLELGEQFGGRFFPELLKDPSHYIKWFNEVLKIMAFPWLLGGLLGMFAFKKADQRAFVIALWFGYGLYGLLFPYHFLTHSYYHLPLIPVVGLSLASISEYIFQGIANLKPRLLHTLMILGIVSFGIFIQLWNTRILLSEDFRHEPAYWREVGETVGYDTDVVALSQDYSNRIAYYGWINALNWPGVGHFNYRELRGGKPVEFDEWFAEYSEGKDFFLVTRLKELDRQPELKDALYEGYEIYAEGPGYIVFDLRKPITP
jgi:hypothetical protein